MPETNIRGPQVRPLLMAFLTATSVKPIAPSSRSVVKPAIRSACALSRLMIAKSGTDRWPNWPISVGPPLRLTCT